eukprot:1303288-Pleurochrysis_carterae.AAC.5
MIPGDDECRIVPRVCTCAFFSTLFNSLAPSCDAVAVRRASQRSDGEAPVSAGCAPCRRRGVRVDAQPVDQRYEESLR